ncbi:glycoside hydrolase superfamily [Xylariales sp. PMI_506]|nr:glycoside hydrolase superfamily [Xylariales sp. PMI_506]
MLIPSILLLPSLAYGLATTPQMGWNSWNAFKAVINESAIYTTADAMISKGLASAGYNYLLIDDGWAAYRDTSGRQQANATRFPSGMEGVAKYAHARGLKVGIYSDAGIMTCSFKPGSHGYEELDAATFADWGIDYLKYDNCGGFQANTLAPQERFSRMASALKDTGREIFYSLCQWGNQFPWLWADQFSDSYRISGDIHASFASDNSGVCTTAYCLNTGYAGVSVLTTIRKMRELSVFQKPGSWEAIGDMDLLEIGNGAMNHFEEQTHFSFWAALKSPLIASTNLLTINQSSLDILLNKDIIAINQDAAGVAVNYIADLSSEGSTQIWAGPLRSGNSKFVILALNEMNTTQDITINLDKVPLFKESARGAGRFRDVWAKEDFKLGNGTVALRDVGVHETKVLVFS